MTLSNSVVVITGGAKGLGKATAEAFERRGAKVVICDKDVTEKGFQADVTDEAQLVNVASKVVEQFGGIDIWVNNAGIWMPPEPLGNIDLQKARKLFDINVFGTINGTRAALGQMNSQKRGTIVNIVSTTAFDGMNGSSGAIYVSSKYAIRGLTNALRAEMKDSPIKIISVYPGGFKTELFGADKPDNIDEFMDPAEVAEKIVANLESSEPEKELIIKRPGQKASYEFANIQK